VKARKPLQATGCVNPVQWRCVMTSRTNHSSAGQQQKSKTRRSPAALQQWREEALKRYLAGDPIEMICQEMGCSKSWLYKWKKRHQFTEPDWVLEHSRRPKSTPTKTPDALEAEIIRLHQTLSPDGSGAVSADVIRAYLRQHGRESIPSRRTIYRILIRQAKEVNTHASSS
jgi:transposase-like protein